MGSIFLIAVQLLDEKHPRYIINMQTLTDAILLARLKGQLTFCSTIQHMIKKSLE